jgi:hypothetical protein
VVEEEDDDEDEEDEEDEDEDEDDQKTYRCICEGNSFNLHHPSMHGPFRTIGDA